MASHSEINEHVSSVYNAIQAYTLLEKASTVLTTKDYERLLLLFHCFSLNPSVAESTILELLSNCNTYLKIEFEMFLSFTNNYEVVSSTCHS